MRSSPIASTSTSAAEILLQLFINQPHPSSQDPSRSETMSDSNEHDHLPQSAAKKRKKN